MRVDGFLQSQNLVKTGLPDVFSRFNVGDVIRAKVLSIVTDELLLKLFDGSEFTAKSDISADIRKGDILELLVNGKRDGQLFVETLKILNSEIQNGKNIKPPAANNFTEKETIETKLLNNNIPASDEVIEGIKKAINLFKNLDIDKSVFLLKNNLELNETNINNLNALIEGKLQLGNEINELSAIMSALSDELSLTVPEDSVYEFTGNSVNSTNDGSINGENAYTALNNSEGPKNLPEQSLISSENRNIFTDDKFNFDDILNSIIDDRALNEMGNSIKQDDIKRIVRHLVDDLNKNQDFSTINANQIRNKVFEILNGKYSLSERVSKRTADIVTEYFTKNNEIVQKPKALLNAIKNEIGKLIFNLDDDASKSEVISKDLYENISDKIDELREIINRVNPDKSEELNFRLDNIKNNISFLQELNKHSSYMQIPVNISNNQRTGELYILKKKGKKAIDKENVSVLISLNTVNLGQIDTLVNMRYRNISISMRVEDEKIIKVLKDNYKILYDSLLETGCKLVNMRYLLKGEKINPVNIEKVIDKEFEFKLGNIDYKI